VRKEFEKKIKPMEKSDFHEDTLKEIKENIIINKGDEVFLNFLLKSYFL